MIANAKKISMAVVRRFAGGQSGKRTLLETKDWFKRAPPNNPEPEKPMQTKNDQKLEVVEKKAPTLLFAQKPKQSSKPEPSKYEDDVHSSRFKKLTENKQYASEDEKKKAHTFFFNRSEEKTIPVYLDDINIINIDNEETFHKVPRLGHKLDVVV